MNEVLPNSVGGDSRKLGSETSYCGCVPGWSITSIQSMIRLLPILVVLLTGNLFAATVAFDLSAAGVTPSGATLFRYTYSFTDITLQAGQEIDIRFDPARFGTLSNGVAGPGFDLMLLQPNNPPGAFGDYSLFALINNPLLAGRFSVDFIYNGPGQPGSQPYLINQYNQSGIFVGTIGSGVTTPAAPTAIPEPATFGLTGVGSLVAGSLWAFRFRRRPIA